MWFKKQAKKNTHTHTRLTEAAGELPFLAEAFRLGAPDGDASKGVLRRAAFGGSYG